MKKILLLSLILSLGLFGFSQNRRVTFSKSLQNYSVKTMKVSDDNATTAAANVQNEVKNKPAKSGKSIDEEEIGQTIYDLQSNECTPYGRFFYYEDGTMGAVWTKGSGTYTDRGTGYNFFNGTTWAAEPTARIESVKTGWPSYAPLGVSGEIVAAHTSASGLAINKRTTKGTGTWSQTIFPGPTGHVDIAWPRMVTSGENHNTVNMIAITMPVANGGTTYQGLDGALVYSRSTDGGATWEKNNVILDGLTSADYYGFAGDSYSWVEPQGDNLAFIAGGTRHDLVVMKSTDGGDTWQKTVVWEHPYPHWNGTSTTDTFYCPDGSAHGVFDNNGVLHIAFGINRAIGTGSASSWFPFVDGIAYWNENLPTWTGGTQHEQGHCLDPNTLEEQGSLIGWMQDVNGNGQLDLVGTAITSLGNYELSPSSMPQLAVDANNMLYMMYSGVTETFDNGTQQYRHIWGRGSSDGGQTWGNFVDFTGDVLHAYDECVFPVIAAKTDANVHIIYQGDNEPGLSVRGDLDPAGDNYIRHLYPSKDEFGLTPPIGFTVDGTITYPKSTPVPLSGIEIGLKDNGGNVIQTATTNATGTYTFSNVPAGNYTLAPTTTKAWGGVTAGDVLLYKKHIAGINALAGIFLASGDVNASGSLTAGDVLIIKKRIAGIINSFTVGDWAFNNTPLNVEANTTADFNGLAYGDANASYTPAAKGNSIAPKSTTTGEILTIGNVSTTGLGAITVPVHATAINNLGSFQFSVSYDASKLVYVGDANWFTGITAVTINSANPGKISFVWAADSPITISDNTLFEMNFTTTDFGASTIEWSDVPTPREIGDYDGNIMEPTYNNGTIDVSTGINDLNNTAMVVSPNPNNGNFTLDLSSVKSQVSNVKIMNMVGGVVYQQKVAQNAAFNQNINLSNLSDGVYTILIQTNNGDIVKKMVIKK